MHIYWFELVAGRIVFSITFPSELHSMCYWWSLLRVVPASVKTGCGITDSLLTTIFTFIYYDDCFQFGAVVIMSNFILFLRGRERNGQHSLQQTLLN